MAEIISADTREMDALAARLRKSQADVYRALQGKVREVGENTIAPKARAHASYSKKIPLTINVSARGLRVVVRAGGPDVWIAAAFERGRPWRHPVFPSSKVPRNRWHWVEMKNPSRPYLGPALDESTADGTRQLTGAVMDVLRTNLEG